MGNSSALEVAFNAARALPENVQEALAQDLVLQVKKYAKSHLTAQQRAIVIKRLGKPVKIADRENVDQLFEKFTIPA